ncbi:MAG: TPM domain-containing protein [Smithella sp.]|nr:TPM domain-containing protein [Smithella sp.]
MKHSLREDEKNRLETLVVETEKRTGSQVVLSVIERCDAYPEIPWKAFALGCSIASVFALNMTMVNSFDSPEDAVMLALVMILAAGGGLALLCIFFPDFARLFLQKSRAATETRQYAESFFLSREMFATGRRKSVLLLVGLFERQIVVLPDTGLADKINDKAVESITVVMRPLLRSGKTAEALEAGLKKLAEMISGPQTHCPWKNELPDDVIEEKGV